MCDPIDFRICFNPLPSPKQGEIAVGIIQHSAIRVSIRSPHRSKGRYGISDRQNEITEVSIRPLPSPKQGEMLVAVTSRIPKGYTVEFTTQPPG